MRFTRLAAIEQINNCRSGNLGFGSLPRRRDFGRVMPLRHHRRGHECFVNRRFESTPVDRTPALVVSQPGLDRNLAGLLRRDRWLLIDLVRSIAGVDRIAGRIDPSDKPAFPAATHSTMPA